MGNLTAKTSGEIASFMSPSVTNIKSLKVYFSPKQLGTGDPSPENIREIEGWDGVNAYNDPKYGGSIIWNQCFDPSTIKIGSSTSGVFNVTKLDTGFRVTANADASGNGSRVVYFTLKWNRIQNHRYMFLCKIKSDTLKFNYVYFYHANGSSNRPVQNSTGQYAMIETYTGSTATTNASPRLYIYGIELSKDESFEVTDLMAVDLDMMFGTTVIDNLFNNTTTALQRVDWFTSIITNYDYRDYNEGEITTVSAVNNEPYTNLSYQWKLPDEYQEVEYIESDGNQYIQLPFGFDDTDEIETVFSIEQPANDKYINSPSVWNNNGNRFGMGKHTGQGGLGQTFTAAYGTRMTGYTYLEPPTNPDYDLHKWTYKNHVFAIPELETSRDVSDIEFRGTTANLKLFYGYNGNTIGKISYYKHIKSDASYYLIACYRKSDGEIGLYDIVNNVFYTNQGTGTFSKGEDVFYDTAYGGYVDLISGELVEEWGMFTVDEPDTTWRVAAYNRITINFPRKYIFGSRLLKDKSMCTILPENHTDWNYGYIDNVASITSPHALSLNYTGNGEGWSELFGEEVTNENVKSHLQELGFAICATLVEPITHQLTPTQLSSFIGQNNFWSNADYVEVEYDLIETIDIQKAKQKIILNQPQLKTVSDKVVSFNTDMVAPVKNCKIYFNFIQLGSGDPSPTNIRNINGWTGLDSYVNGNKISVDWTSDAGTVYGGYLDLVKNEVVAEKDCIDSYNGETLIGEWISDRDIYTAGNTPTIGAKVVYTLSEPIHYPLSSLTSQQLLTLKSTNNIWSETNGQQIDIKYWTHKNLTPTPLTNYIENQTWTDSAYISSSGKKTTNTVSASHFLTNQILLEAGTYVLSGFSYYTGSDSTRYRIHAYDSTGKWVKQITFQEIDNLSPVDISFTLDTDTYVNLSIAMDFDGVLAKIN